MTMYAVCRRLLNFMPFSHHVSGVNVSSADPCRQDGDFSETRFRDTVNAALANNIGNMLNRTLNLITKNCGGVIPVGAGEVDDKLGL